MARTWPEHVTFTNRTRHDRPRLENIFVTSIAFVWEILNLIIIYNSPTRIKSISMCSQSLILIKLLVGTSILCFPVSCDLSSTDTNTRHDTIQHDLSTCQLSKNENSNTTRRPLESVCASLVVTCEYNNTRILIRRFWNFSPYNKMTPPCAPHVLHPRPFEICCYVSSIRIVQSK